MNPILKSYLKVISVLAVAFGAGSILIDAIMGDEILFSLALLIKSLFFGFMMAVFFISGKVRRLHEMGVTKITDEHLRPTHSKTIESHLDKNALLKVLSSDAAFSKMKIIENDNQITIKSPVSWKSWGEVMHIQPQKSSANQTQYLVSSRPKIKTTLFDFAANFENVMRLEKLLIS